MKNKIIELCRLISIYAGLYMIATIIFIAMFHTSLFQSMDVLTIQPLTLFCRAV